MPMWRCPHCETPQAEAARCWVCHRSSTACGSCRHFRRSVAANVGFCGLDRARRPLRGDEIRGCWEARTASDEAPATNIPRSAPTPATYVEDRTPVRRLEFVEVAAGASGTPDGRVSRSRDQATDGRQSRQAEVESEAGSETAFEARSEVESLQEATMAFEPGAHETRWSLWGDLEG